MTETYFQDPNTLAVHAAQEVTDAIVTVFSDTVPVRNPPPSWSPLTATDAELDYYGLPPRPSSAAEVAEWAAEWASYTWSPPPALCVARDLRAATYSPTWAGAIALGRNDYTRVVARLTEPTASYCPGSSPSSHVSWVGLGGFNTDGGLMQNGTIQTGKIVVDPSTKRQLDHFWFELISGGTPAHDTGIWMLNFNDTEGGVGAKVKSGDVIDVATAYIPSAKKVKFYFHNVSTGYVKTIGPTDHFPDKDNVRFSVESAYYGGTAEVIDERTENLESKKYDQLRKFTPVQWRSAKVSFAGGTPVPIRQAPKHAGLTMWSKASGTMAGPDGNGLPADAFNDNWRGCGVVEPES
jgi:hypothetical protein